MNQRIKLAAACVACLLVGYFAGREHVKYQIRTAMSEAVSSLQRDVSGALSGSSAAPVPATAPAPKRTATVDQPMTGTLLNKGFRPKDLDNGQYSEYIEFTVKFDNKTDKDIRAFDGVLSFTDLLDNEIIGSKVEINEPVASKGSLSWEGGLEYNQFMDDHQRFRAEPAENLKMRFLPGKILFTDGTTETFNQ